jgi:hypothetical protein
MMLLKSDAKNAVPMPMMTPPTVTQRPTFR